MEHCKEVALLAYYAAGNKFGITDGYGTVESPKYYPKDSELEAAFEHYWQVNYDPNYQPAPYPEPLGEKEGLFVVVREEDSYTGGLGVFSTNETSYSTAEFCISQWTRSSQGLFYKIERYYTTKEV